MLADSAGVGFRREVTDCPCPQPGLAGTHKLADTKGQNHGEEDRDRNQDLEEAREGESLDQHLSEEEPEVWESGDEDDVEAEDEPGRLVDPDYGAIEDTEKDEVAIDAGRAGYARSAEEAAMHYVDDEDDS